MADIKWIKLSTAMFDDEKIKLIQAMPEGDSILVIWIRLLTLAGKINENGYVYLSQSIPYTDDMFATIFNKPVQIIRLAIQTFNSLQMIESNEYGINLINWGKHQNIEGMELIKVRARLRQQKHRALLKQGDNEVSRDNSVTVTPQIRVDKSKSKSKNKTNTDEINKLFNIFWEEYPKKVSKLKAFDTFKKIKPTDDLIKIIISKLELLKKTDDWIKDNGQYIPNPATWLNGHRWEDEIKPGGNNGKAKDYPSIPGNRPNGAFDGL